MSLCENKIVFLQTKSNRNHLLKNIINNLKSTQNEKTFQIFQHRTRS